MNAFIKSLPPGLKHSKEAEEEVAKVQVPEFMEDSKKIRPSKSV